ncbi:MAG: 5'-deoxynucleotidase [Ruminococcus sp.]|nr:5'-deoxynucleotidase [Ruminococcus sp.]
MSYKFFAMMSRMKYIDRWALMRNTINENISEHSLETAIIAHALALLGNKRLGKNYNAERAALLAMYHDATEIITGDLPTPIKYYNKQIKSVYNEIEDNAERQMLSFLPEDLREEYRPLFSRTEEEAELWRLVKAADKLSALIKCVEERRMGNVDFASAEESTVAAVHALNCPEAEMFMTDFMPSYDLTLDEQTK